MMFSSNTPSVFGLVIISAGDVFVDDVLQRFQIDHAAVVRLDVLDRVAGHRGRRGIGAVRRIRNQDLLARIALRFRAARGSAGCRSSRRARRPPAAA